MKSTLVKSGLLMSSLALWLFSMFFYFFYRIKQQQKALHNFIVLNSLMTVKKLMEIHTSGVSWSGLD